MEQKDKYKGVCTYIVINADKLMAALPDNYVFEIKIGKSTDPILRLGVLNSGSADNLALLGCFLGDKEKFLHKLYKDYHIRGEWYCLPFEEMIELLFFSDYDMEFVWDKYAISCFGIPQNETRILQEVVVCQQLKKAEERFMRRRERLQQKQKEVIDKKIQESRIYRITFNLFD